MFTKKDTREINEKLNGLIEMLERSEKELNENLQVLRKYKCRPLSNSGLEQLKKGA